VAEWAEARRRTGQVRVLLRRWIIQIVLNMLLIAGILIAASATPQSLRDRLSFVPGWLGGAEGALFLGALLACLPILVAVLRKLRATAMLMAEATIARKGADQQPLALRQLVTRTIVGLGTVAIALFIFTVGASILPSWPVVLVLLAIVAGVMVSLWRHFTRVYARAQIAVREVLDAPTPMGNVEDPIGTLLTKAMLDSITIADGSMAAGKLIRELELRSRTGATIVAVERGRESVISPSPDEELRAGDTLLLIGAAEQVELARNLLRPKEPRTPGVPDAR